jgi:acyl carrier protein
MADANLVERQLAEIFRVVLDVDGNYDVKSVRRLNERRWDSLAHISLIVAIESEFGIRLEIAEMERMTSFAATRVLVEEKSV